jgi:hypothetical protein
MRSIRVEEHVRLKADEMYKQDNHTGRQSKRKLMIYHYLYRAYNESQTPYNPHRLAKEVGIPITKIQTAMCMFAKEAKSRSPTTRDKSRYNVCKRPRDYVESQIIYTGLSHHHTKDILELLNVILEKDEDLCDAQPQVVSAAVMMYFMELEQVAVPPTFRAEVNIPKSTLENMYRHVCSVHNQ